MTKKRVRVHAVMVVIAAAIAFPAQQLKAQLSRFQGTWVSEPSESRLITRLAITATKNNITAWVQEDCDQEAAPSCSYVAPVDVYGPRPSVNGYSLTTAITFSYVTPDWRRLTVVSWSEGRLAAEVYSLPIADRVNASSFASHQLFFRAAFAVDPGKTDAVSQGMAQFPWPPPHATQREVLPRGLVTKGRGERLGSAFDNIKQALQRGGIAWSVYAIKDSGFAVVTRLETIGDDGKPKPVPERWSGLDASPARPTTFFEYLSSLLVARPGHYRVIVLAVTSLPSSGGAFALSADSARKLLAGGEDDLPQWLGNRKLRADGRCIALIYEFRRRSESDPVEAVPSSEIGAQQHLVLAGLWPEEAFRK